MENTQLKSGGDMNPRTLPGALVRLTVQHTAGEVGPPGGDPRHERGHEVIVGFVVDAVRAYGPHLTLIGRVKPEGYWPGAQQIEISWDRVTRCEIIDPRYGAIPALTVPHAIHDLALGPTGSCGAVGAPGVIGEPGSTAPHPTWSEFYALRDRVLGLEKRLDRADADLGVRTECHANRDQAQIDVNTRHMGRIAALELRVLDLEGTRTGLYSAVASLNGMMDAFDALLRAQGVRK